MRSVQVHLGERSYPVLIGQGLISQLGRWIKKQNLQNHSLLIVSQKEIAGIHGDTVHQVLRSEGLDCAWFIPPAGKSSESAKSQAVYAKLLKTLASREGKNQSSALIAFGGGVVGDLTGFAAAVYRRGIPYIQIPTTLTAQVDSAIGGKTGIDLPEGKNLLGVIYQPALVLSDTNFLKSLPERQWSDGFAEVIKYGVTLDAALFRFLERHGKAGIQTHAGRLEKIIFRSVRIKARVTANDEFDKKGIRLVLNFGHTAGHAIEAASRFSSQVTHGEGVAIGMLIAFDISAQLGILKDKALSARLEKILLKFDLPTAYRGLTLDAIEKALGYDKKAEGGTNRFVLPVSLGRTMIQKNVPREAIREALLRRKS